MAVSSRLRELRAEGKHELADTLAAEVLRNETPTVTVKTDHVRVETATFVGEHALSRPLDSADEEAVRDVLARTGRYRLVDDETGRTFTAGCLYDAVVARLLDAAVPDSAEEETVPTANGPITDAGRTRSTDVDAVTSVETTRTPTAVIRQAVAAVQSQFRD